MALSLNIVLLYCSFHKQFSPQATPAQTAPAERTDGPRRPGRRPPHTSRQSPQAARAPHGRAQAFQTGRHRRTQAW